MAWAGLIFSVVTGVPLAAEALELPWSVGV